MHPVGFGDRTHEGQPYDENLIRALQQCQNCYGWKIVHKIQRSSVIMIARLKTGKNLLSLPYAYGSLVRSQLQFYSDISHLDHCIPIEIRGLLDMVLLYGVFL